MKIAILIKQTPDSGSVKMDESTGTVVRSGSNAVINPLDIYALEAAIQLRRRYGAQITVFSMGPPCAESVLRESLALCVSSAESLHTAQTPQSQETTAAVLITDRAFAGSDTWATGYILAESIRRQLPDFDLVLTGERATDGDTGQVGPETAAALNAPIVAGVAKIDQYENGTITLQQLFDGKIVHQTVQTPAVLTISKAIGAPQLPTLAGKIRAREAEIKTITQSELNLPSDRIGLAGSPTRIVRVFHPHLTRTSRTIQVTDDATLAQAVEAFYDCICDDSQTSPESNPDGENSNPSKSNGNSTAIVNSVQKSDSVPNPNAEIFVLASENDLTTYELIARAKQAAEPEKSSVRVVSMGSSYSKEYCEQVISYGADTVYRLFSPQFTQFRVDIYAQSLLNFINQSRPRVLIAAADSIGRILTPYLAQQLRTGLTADCTSIHLDTQTGLLDQTRPAIGGSIMATIRCPNNQPQMATVRPHSYRPLSPDWNRTGEIVPIPAFNSQPSRITILDVVQPPEQFSIQNAKRIVAVGRGFRRKENIALATAFAKQLNAAVGGSREAVDRGWLEYPAQIGLSGKTVMPDLYIALGISGAIQHLAGMQTARKIVAVNRDPNAQIFKVADLAIVGDLFQILPALMERAVR